MACCLSLGVVTSRFPLVGIAVAIGVVGLSIGMFLPRVPARLFLAALGVGLVGYAFLGRPFAHFGVAPLYFGEMILATGLLYGALEPQRLAAFRSPIGWAIASFMLLGGVHLFQDIGTYGMEAVRDSAVWIYAAFALLVVPVVLRLNLFRAVPDRYARILPFFVLWVVIGFMFARVIGLNLPPLPGSTVPLLQMKAGDLGVHLGGVAAFLILGLYQTASRSDASRPPMYEWFWWGVWLVAFIGVGSINRGGMLAAMIAASIALLFTGTAAVRKLLILGSACVLIVTVSLIADFEFDGGRRTVSVNQIVENITSVVDDDSGASSDGTRAWRLRWWTDIVNYTVFGDHFWEGKGFGINLADADGYQVEEDGSVRSPHNGHLTILARMGVPGLGLWVLIHGLFALGLIRACFRSYQRGLSRWVHLNAWILAYWAAFMVNATFDVFIEGPQGGIWFWSLVGFGIAAMIEQEKQGTQPSLASSGPAHHPLALRSRP